MNIITRPLLCSLFLVAFSTATLKAQQVVDVLPLDNFSDGFTDWTFTDLTVPTDTILWEYATDPAITGPFSNILVRSETVDNGYALLNFDRFADGNTFQPGVVNELTSPSFDLTSLDPGRTYELAFYSIARECCTGGLDHTIQFSLDGGSTFTDPQLISPFFPSNCIEEVIKKFSLPQGVENASEFQVRFTYDGEFFYWAIDDITVSALNDVEPEVLDFFAIAPNLETPTDLAGGFPMSFVADIQNNGAATLDFQLAITIADSNAVVIYTDTLLYEGISEDSIAENRVFPMTTLLPTAIGEYTGTYEIFTDRIAEDDDLTNNTQTFAFSVTEESFSKAAPVRTIDCCADDSDFSSGNIYYTPGLTSANSRLLIDEVSFAFDAQNFTDADEAIIEVKTYGFRGDLNEDGAPNYGLVDDPTAELVELSFLAFQIDTSSLSVPSNTLLTLPPNRDGTSVMVDIEEYIGFAVQVDYFASTDGGTNVDNDFNIFGDNIDYAPIQLAADSTGNARLNSYLVVPDRAIDVYGYFGGVTPFIDASVTVEGVNAVEETVLATSQFSVRPNPATTQFSIDFDFGTAVDAQFEIINAVGQTVSVFNRDGLSSGAITIPTQGMNNGLYYVNVRTENGQTATRKLLLNR